jgi:serine/threonine-protein kinase
MLRHALDPPPGVTPETVAALSPALGPDDHGPTLTLEAVLAPRAGAGGGEAEVSVVEREGDDSQGLTRATDDLRRVRLRAASGFLALTLAALVLWRAVTGGGPLLVTQALIAAALGAAWALLAGRLPLSHRRLRQVEFAVFGLTSAYLAARQYQGLITWIGGEPDVEGASVVSAVKTTLIGTMLLTFAYCMMIPNTWRTAAAAVLALTAVPVATELVLYLNHPEAYHRARRFATLERVAEDVALMLIAGGLSVYGTRVINGLRTEAYEARQLNQYRLVRKLGSGGMGEVHLAEHRLLKRPCAVKIIRPGSEADPIELRRFEREVQATARLSHPNTVEIFDYGRTTGGTFYYVMEYLPGLTLDELANRHGPMPPGRVVCLLRQVCGALAEAHAAGLVHRDVKPANIFASCRGGQCDVAKLLDFGLVKGPALGTGREPTDVSRAGMVRGSPLYMAPEQILGDGALDHRCDLYALGAVAYRLVTGKPPFVRDTRLEVMSAHAREAVFPPSRIRPDVPPDLEQVIMQCLAKSPADRYRDADHLGAALAACRSADDWDATAAALWWQEHEPQAIRTLPQAPATAPA